jgi:hypothetical protein
MYNTAGRRPPRIPRERGGLDSKNILLRTGYCARRRVAFLCWGWFVTMPPSGISYRPTPPELLNMVPRGGPTYPRELRNMMPGISGITAGIR